MNSDDFGAYTLPFGGRHCPCEIGPGEWGNMRERLRERERDRERERERDR